MPASSGSCAALARALRRRGPFEREFKGLKEFAEISLGESVQMARQLVGATPPQAFSAM